MLMECSESLGGYGNNKMFGKNSDVYKGWLEKKTYFDRMPYGIEVANTGSTAGCRAFDYSFWPERGFNLGGMPQTLYYDFEILKKYSGHLKKKAKIFLCIEEFKFLIDHYPDRKSTLKYYFLLEPHQIHGYCEKTKKRLNRFPFLEDRYLARNELVKIGKKILHWQPDIPKFSSDKERDAHYSRYWLDLWFREFSWEWISPRLSRIQKENIRNNTERLKNMLEYSTGKELEPYIIIVPFSPGISALLPKDIMEECLFEPLELLKQEGYRVIDMFHDKRMHDSSLYEDSISLNDKGRRVFNVVIRGLMEENGNA